VVGRQRRAGRDVCDSGRGLDPAVGTVGDDDRAGNSGADDGFEEVLDFWPR
jgi:hypothetical protein